MMATGYCSKCGTELPPEAEFCPRCGAKVLTTEPPPPAPPTPPLPPTPPAPPGLPAAASGPGAKPWLYPAIVGALAVVLIGGVLVVTRDSDPSPGTAPGEVFLEPASFSGDAPFTESVDTNTAPPPVRLANTSSPVVTPSPSTPATPRTVGVRSVQGPAPGLYGGSRNESACDAERMVAFLQSNPAKAAAWAAVQGITPAEIPSFVRSLTPLVLRADTRVTNHGYRNGRATPLQSVLQAGTAVLVDDLGQPRVKCGCGNPLAPPKPQRRGVRYTGNRWRGFQPINVIVVVNTTQIKVTEFVLVDLAQPGYFVRPIGVPEPNTPPADGEVLIDSVCDLFPEDCGSRPGEPVLGTGDVQITLRWNSTADLDLAVADPSGETVNFDHRSSASGGQLDVDSNGGCAGNVTSTPVENVFWPSGQSPDGQYAITVSYYRACPGGEGPQSFELSVLMGGVPVAVQPLSTDGSGSTFTLLAANGGTRANTHLALAQAAGGGTLSSPGDKYTVTATKAGTPGGEPPAGESPAPPTVEEPAQPAPEQPETLEQYCTRTYPDPASIGYILCVHDPTQNDVSGEGPMSLPVT